MTCFFSGVISTRCPAQVRARRPTMPPSDKRESDSLDHKEAEIEDLSSDGALPDLEEASRTDLPQGRQIGVISATFLITNRMLGTGIFSTPSTILSESGSVGMSLIYWLIGGIVAGIGFAVFAEFATAIPRNGGELNYLQYVFRKPRYLTVSMYAAQALLLGQAAGNANAAGQYFIRAGGGKTTEWNSKGVGVAIILAALFMHGFLLKWGLRLQNLLGLFKVVILLLIVLAGFAALAGRTKIPQPYNFHTGFSGTRNDVYAVSNSLYNALWSYTGYNNVFYALAEVKRPARTLRIAGPLAISVLTVLYVLAQIAYFAAVPLEKIRDSQQIVAASFFKNMFGERSARALSAFVALSAVGNVFSVLFAQGRLNQALGREGVIPFSKLFASNRPCRAPLVGLAWHAVMTLILMLAPPQGDAFNFVLNLSQYPMNLVNAAVGIGLCLTYQPRRLRPAWLRDWSPLFRATLPVALIFALVSLFLVIAPWIPPQTKDEAVYNSMWYALAPAVGLGFFAAGAAYWFVWYILLPFVGRYRLETSTETLGDGSVRTVWERRPRHAEDTGDAP